MTEEQIKRKAKTYSKNYWYNTNNSVNVASIEKILVDFTTEITKELQETYKKQRNKRIDELQKKNKQAKEIIRELLSFAEYDGSNFGAMNVRAKAEAFLFLNDAPKFNEDLENCRGWHAKENLIKE